MAAPIILIFVFFPSAFNYIIMWKNYNFVIIYIYFDSMYFS